MEAVLGSVAILANIAATMVEIGLIGAAASMVVVGIWGIKKSRKAL